MSGFDGIYEIDPSDATILNQVYVGFVNQLAFNPINGKLVFDANGQLWEIAPDGTGLEMVDIPGTNVSGMAFTPTGDLVLLASDQLFLYDRSDDADAVFKFHLKGVMLELRPTCEHCNKALPPDSIEARICSYERTFCVTCVEQVLENVCPNCGGGFVPRPIRPSTNWKGENFLGKDPASTKVKHRPVDPAAHAQFSARIKPIPPAKR